MYEHGMYEDVRETWTPWQLLYLFRCLFEVPGRRLHIEFGSFDGIRDMEVVVGDMG